MKDISSVLDSLNEDDRKLAVDMLANDHFRQVVLACWSIYNRKGNDYTRGKGDLDRLDNFRVASEHMGITMEQALGVYTYKHWSAIERYCKEGAVESEPIESRLYDMINYSILLLLWIRESKGE